MRAQLPGKEERNRRCEAPRGGAVMVLNSRCHQVERVPLLHRSVSGWFDGMPWKAVLGHLHR